LKQKKTFFLSLVRDRVHDHVLEKIQKAGDLEMQGCLSALLSGLQSDLPSELQLWKLGPQSRQLSWLKKIQIPSLMISLKMKMKMQKLL